MDEEIQTQQTQILVVQPMKNQPPELLRIRDVAKIFRVDETSVLRWIKNGSLEAITLPTRPGGTRQVYRIKRSTVEAILGAEITDTDL